MTLFEDPRLKPLAKIERRCVAFLKGRINEMSENQPFKKHPGDWLRWRMLERLMPAFVLAMMSFAYLLAIALVWLAQSLTLLLSPLNLTITILPGVTFFIAAFIFARGGRRPWKIEHMRKGAYAESLIGHAIEYSITRQACAVAHNVMDIVDRGDIDHLVATPGGLWVVETKSKRHSPTEKSKLEDLSGKVKDVRNWAPRDTRVVGCLVYANDAGPGGDAIHKIYGESIRTFRNRKSLSDTLRREAHEDLVSQELANRVWQLSVGEIEGN